MNAEEILTKELKHDPCNCGYSGLDVDGVLAALLARVQVQIRPLTSGQCLEWAAQGRAWAIVQAGISGRGPDGERLENGAKSVAVGAAALLNYPDGVVDLNRGAHAALLDVMVDSGVITSDDRQALYRMAAVDVSRAEQLGLGTSILRGDVIRAMGAQ